MNDVLKLPNTWVQVTVADLGKVVSGGTPSTKEDSYWGGNISWISPSDLTGYSSKHIAKGAKSITPEGLKNSSATIMPAGSIHFSSRAPIGYTVISSCDMTTNQGFKSLVPAHGVFNEYVYYYFKSAKQLAESRATGTTFKEISGTAFGKLPVPLPPTNEQHRIVAKIEELFSELDKGVENLKTAQAQLKVYRQALLKHAFEGKLTTQWRAENQDKLETATALLNRIQLERAQRFQQQLAEWEASGKQGSKPKAPKPLPPLTAEELAELPELPEGWAWIRLGEVFADNPKNGIYKSADNYGSGFSIIRIDDFYDGTLSRTSGFKKVRLSVDEIETFTAHVGDILINRVNSIEYLGKCCEIKGLAEPVVFESNIMKTTLAANQVLNIFVTSYLSSYFGRRRLCANAKHAVNQASINQTDVAMTPIPLAQMGEQTVIAEQLDAQLSEVDQLDQIITTSLQQAESLRQSILKKAFSGRLVAQNAKDEPASVLLERIKAEKEVQSVTAKPRNLQKAQSKPAPAKSNVIPFPVKLAGISTTDLHAGILARAYQHHENAPQYLAYFGHVKAEKIAHLVEAHLGIDLGREPIKAAAGPNDYPHLKKIESRAQKSNWFNVRQKKDGGGYVFNKRHGFDGLLVKTQHALGDQAAAVDELIDILLPLNTRQAEIVATLYAAWNNLLLLGCSPSDEEIVYEARENWHTSKLEIERNKFFRGLEWMRQKGLVPEGKGRYVDVKGNHKSPGKPS